VGREVEAATRPGYQGAETTSSPRRTRPPDPLSHRTPREGSPCAPVQETTTTAAWYSPRSVGNIHVANWGIQTSLDSIALLTAIAGDRV